MHMVKARTLNQCGRMSFHLIRKAILHPNEEFTVSETDPKRELSCMWMIASKDYYKSWFPLRTGSLSTWVVMK